MGRRESINMMIRIESSTTRWKRANKISIESQQNREDNKLERERNATGKRKKKQTFLPPLTGMTRFPLPQTQRLCVFSPLCMLTPHIYVYALTRGDLESVYLSYLKIY